MTVRSVLDARNKFGGCWFGPAQFAKWRSSVADVAKYVNLND
jgi:hypothetical protein